MLDAIGIMRTRDTLRDHLTNVIRMMDEADTGKPGHTVATIEATCNAASSALTTAASDIDAIKSAYRRKLAPTDPRAWPRAPRLPSDADFVSPASAA